jgi:kynurenine formamidase
MTKIIDLSQEIYQGMPVYPGHLKTVIWEHTSHEETYKIFNGEFSYNSMGLLLSDHGPTHTDAISHLDSSPDAETIDELPLDRFYTSAIAIDVSHVPFNQYVTKKDIEQACEAADLNIEEGDTLLLYTGHYLNNYGTPRWLEGYTGLDFEATELLGMLGVVNIGIDAPSIDNPNDKTYPAHNVCKKYKMLNTENLGDIRPVVGKRFQYIGFPLKIRGGSGSPIRAVAVLND